MTKKFSVKLMSPSCNIILPEPINQFTAIRINKLLYNVVSWNQNTICVSMESFNQHTYFDGMKTHKYLFGIFNNGPGLVSFSNTTDNYDYQDKNYRSINNLQLNLICEGNYLTDVSVSNPFFIEFEFI